MCCVLEKSNVYQKDGFIKSGFHIEFPFLLCSRDEQRAFLFPKLEVEYKQHNMFTRYQPFPQNIFDTKAVTSNPWLLYGSKKDNAKESYRLTKIIDQELNEISIQQMMESNCGRD